MWLLASTPVCNMSKIWDIQVVFYSIYIRHAQWKVVLVESEMMDACFYFSVRTATFIA
uniref:Uncharacterized protein n=1 Tax=Arion vulgaris TaxID=1028688 RepID=A0A0B6ZFG2_9EUPU